MSDTTAFWSDAPSSEADQATVDLSWIMLRALSKVDIGIALDVAITVFMHIAGAAIDEAPENKTPILDALQDVARRVSDPLERACMVRGRLQ